jgi:uncharacterized BrkB/YihY/UPF0761 family membrane protein
MGARLIVVTIQRGIRLIYSASGRNTAVKENVLTFAVELPCLVAVVVILVGSEGTRLLVDSEVLAPRADMHGIAAIPAIIPAALDAAPVAALLLFVHFTYLVIPSTRPRLKTATVAAMICVAAYLGFAGLLRFFVDSARYNLLYGVFGRLIIVLVNVYAFFTLYFCGCELAHVHDHFDALLFARFYRVARAPPRGPHRKGPFHRARPPPLRLRQGLSLRIPHLQRGRGRQGGPLRP